MLRVGCFLVSPRVLSPLYRVSSCHSAILSTKRLDPMLEQKKGLKIKPELHMKNLNLNSISEKAFTVLNEVQLKDLKKAPIPAFWYGTAGLTPIWFAPITQILVGHSALLTTLQITYGATLVSYLGGVKWGYEVASPDGKLSWESLGWSIVPQFIGWASLLLPHTLAALTISGGIALAGYIDLTTMNYPKWFKALRLFLTLGAAGGFMFSFILMLLQR